MIKPAQEEHQEAVNSKCKLSSDFCPCLRQVELENKK